MKAHITIENGKARLREAVYLKPDAPAEFTVEIPDEAVDAKRDWFPEEVANDAGSSPAQVPPASPGSLQEELNAILGVMARIRPGGSIGDDHESLIEAIEERYYGR